MSKIRFIVSYYECSWLVYGDLIKVARQSFVHWSLIYHRSWYPIWPIRVRKRAVLVSWLMKFINKNLFILSITESPYPVTPDLNRLLLSKKYLTTTVILHFLEPCVYIHATAFKLVHFIITYPQLFIGYCTSDLHFDLLNFEVDIILGHKKYDLKIWEWRTVRMTSVVYEMKK